jgi:Protein of unknown function with PCYCGC motif
MDRRYEEIPVPIGRRSFLATGALMVGVVVSGMLSSCKTFGATRHSYKLAPESVLPMDIRQAPADVREAYRFAIANRDVLRYIPCYCGCVNDGHTSNASCYIKDSSRPGNLVFDRMSLN